MNGKARYCSKCLLLQLLISMNLYSTLFLGLVSARLRVVQKMKKSIKSSGTGLTHKSNNSRILGSHQMRQ